MNEAKLGEEAMECWSGGVVGGKARGEESGSWETVSIGSASYEM